MCADVRFAHLSDWHATTLVGGGRGLWSAKRISGWASWRLSRRHRHSETVLQAAFRDVQAQGVDKILVTGDLTHVSLESEFRRAAEQLALLGSSDELFLIPGNHDCYVPIAAARSWDLWAPYLAGLDPDAVEPEIGECLRRLEVGRAPRHEDYPTLRITGRLAMVGLCSAIPTPIFRAGGRLGEAQLDRLEKLLGLLRDRGYCRVLMIHHPVAAMGEPTRRALWDAEALRDVLARVGAELVLHGHKHRRLVNRIPGPESEIPVVGVPSSSEVGSRPEKRARYHVYTARPVEGGGFALEATVRGFEPERGEFGAVEDSLL